MNILAKVIIIIERLYYVCTHTCMFVLYNRVFGRSQRFSIIWNANFWYQCLCVQTQAYERLSFYLFTCKNLCTSGSTVWGACVLANICVRFRGVDFQNISKGCFFFEYSFAIYGFSLAFSHFLYRYSPLCWWVLISIRLVGRSFDRILFLLLLLPLFATYPRWIRHQFSIYLSISFFNFVSSICQVS